MNGDELKMMKKIPRGMYFTAREKMTKETVPTAHLKIRVGLRSSVISPKRLTLARLLIRADALMLKSDRKKTNSKTVTPRFVSMSFVNDYKVV